MGVRFLRIWMNGGANTCDAPMEPVIAELCGYSIRELYLARSTETTRFTHSAAHAGSGSNDYLLFVGRSVGISHRIWDHKAGAGGIRFVLHQRRDAADCAWCRLQCCMNTPENAARDAYLKKRGYPSLTSRWARRRWPVMLPGRLRRTLSAVGDGAAPR